MLMRASRILSLAIAFLAAMLSSVWSQGAFQGEGGKVRVGDGP